LIGFRPIMVWPVEKTSGEKDVDYGIDEDLPEFYGKEVANEWGIDITQGFENPQFHAYFSKTTNEIKMATSDQQTFFHELAHAAELRVFKDLKGGQDAGQEIVAEFSSVVLMRLFGLESGTKNAYDYIKHYSKELGSDTVKSVAPFLRKIDKVVSAILETNEKLTGMKIV
jgi:antirestriction protein ArdC